MLHLFNKVYVYPDFMLDNTETFLLVSNKPHVQGLQQTLDDANGKQSIGVIASTSEQLFEKLNITSWFELFQYLMSNQTVNVYADMDTINKIYVAFIKTIFPAITNTLAYKIYNTYVQRITICLPSVVSNKSFVETRKQDMFDIRALSKTKFSSLFNSMPLPDEDERKQWVNENIIEFSFEYHIATYFNDNAHFDNFKDKYVYFITKACYNEVYEWYEFFSNHFMMPAAKATLKHNIDWDSENWREQLKQHPDIGWFFDDDLMYVTRNYQYFITHIAEAKRVADLMLDFVNRGLTGFSAGDRETRKLKRICLVDQDYFASTHVQYVYETLERIMISFDELDDEYLKQYIHNDIQNENVSALFDLLNDTQKHNSWLMEMIYELRDNNSDELKQINLLL